MYTLKNKELFWDNFLIEKSSDVAIKNHKPVRKNIAFTADKPWEGELCGYLSQIYTGEKYILYYRAGGYTEPGICTSTMRSAVCVAESTDGKTYTRPNLGIYEFDGSKENNIVYMLERNIDNFSVFYDENPNCPADAKFKGLTDTYPGGNGKLGLAFLKSGNGYHFEFVGELPIEGTFDSLNVGMWNKADGKYRIYFRNFHTPDGSDIPIGKHNDTSVRDIRYVESGDFASWTKPVRIKYTDGREDIQYYTSGITKYPDSEMYFGIPARYIDRASEKVNFRYLPALSGFREELIKNYGRSGTAVTDCTTIFSRDGHTFERSGEAFCTPGIENNENWIYGDCYFSRGICKTESDYPFEPQELSFYKCHGYRHRPVDVVRYTLRIDGFRSWSAGNAEGYVLTKPMIIGGDTMSANFATSALGYLRVVICDEDGTPMDGYDSGTLFGDSIERPVEFSKKLTDLGGKIVKLKIYMSECDLYSVTVK